MKKWLITCSVDAIDIDYETTIQSESEPDWWICESIACQHGCEWWIMDEIKD